MSYIDSLIQDCKSAKVAIPIKEFEFKKLSDLDGIDQAIYVIEQIDGDIEDTFLGFAKYKAKKDRKCSKLNSPSKVMYVGSSITGVKKRIEQHLGNGHKETYSLHLKYWFNGDYKITIKQYSETARVLQIIEDSLSDQLKPAFGKQGGNNK